MKALVVLAHPRRASFTGALSESFIDGLKEAGHTVEFADLTREGFDPCFKPEDYVQFQPAGNAAMPRDVLHEQERLARAEVLTLVFPVFWWSFPALLKGWIDRVMTEGWAYRFTPEKVEGLLAIRKVMMLGAAGSTAASFRRYGYHGAMQRQIDAGIFGYCGITDVETHIFPQVDSDAEGRPGCLDAARKIGRTLELKVGAGVFSIR